MFMLIAFLVFESTLNKYFCFIYVSYLNINDKTVIKLSQAMTKLSSLKLLEPQGIQSIFTRFYCLPMTNRFSFVIAETP